VDCYAAGIQGSYPGWGHNYCVFMGSADYFFKERCFSGACVSRKKNGTMRLIDEFQGIRSGVCQDFHGG
jgi:hypothetical protein